MSLSPKEMPEFSILSQEETFAAELEILHTMGVDYISFGKIFAKGEIYSFFSNPKWAKFYRENRLFLQDPCLHSLYKTVNILASWRHFSEDSPVMQKRREICQIYDGLSLYDRRDPHSSIIMGIGSSDPQAITSILDSPKALSTLFYLKKEVSRKLSSPRFCAKAIHFYAHRPFSHH